MSRQDDPRLFFPQCHDLEPVTTVHVNPWFSVKNRGGYFTVECNAPQVLVLPIVDARAIVMVRVYRPVIADNTLELPAGGIDGDEAPAVAAARELHEETGISLADLNRFDMLPPLVHMVRSPTLPYIFQVRLTQREYDLRSDHDHEIAGVECFPFSEVLRKIEQGELYVGLQIAVIMRYFICNQIIRQSLDAV
ncbi:MAG: NUDIX hydrolase [Deltaproteobacteria bacterium]|nr:NUDIX hydrolase [Deltaproteobacteria bacterium]